MESAARRGHKLSSPAISPAFPFPHRCTILRLMNLDEIDVQEFSRLWSEEFYEEISMNEARQYASALLELYVALARPLPGEVQLKGNNQSSANNEVLSLLSKIERR